MKKAMLTAFAAAIGATVSGESISGDTLLRFAPMPKAPVIDGKIEYNEWKYASTTFGGISPKSKLMTRRQNDFRIGYDSKNVYLYDDVSPKTSSYNGCKPYYNRFIDTNK